MRKSKIEKIEWDFCLKVINKLWANAREVPLDAKRLMEDDKVEYMLQIIKIYHNDLVKSDVKSRKVNKRN